MAIGYSTTIRTARLQVVADAINGGAGAGLLRLYDGTRPATGGAATTLLAELTLSDPVESTIAAGVFTFDTITDDASANNSGTATWARAVDSTGAFCADFDVDDVGSGADIEMNNRVIVATAPVEAVSFVITAGNA